MNFCRLNIPIYRFTDVVSSTYITIDSYKEKVYAISDVFVACTYSVLETEFPINENNVHFRIFLKIDTLLSFR